jgi:hypothetical protein
MYFLPTMLLFLIYPLCVKRPLVNETVDFFLVFGFATVNFVIGYGLLWNAKR